MTVISQILMVILFRIFSGRFDTSGSMIPLFLLVPEIEGGTLSVAEEEEKKDRVGGIIVS